MDILNIRGEKNIAEDALSRLLNNINQETTRESTYTTETMSELYDIKELSEGMFPLYLKLIDHYHREDSILMEILNSVEYIKGYFCGIRNTTNLVMFNDKIVIPQLIQRYIMKWYHTYLFHPGLDRTEAIIPQHL